MEFELIYDFGPCDCAYLYIQILGGMYYMISVYRYTSFHITFALDISCIKGNVFIFRFRFQVTGDHIGARSFKNLLGAAAVSDLAYKIWQSGMFNSQFNI